MKQYSFYNTDLLIDGSRVDGFIAAQSVITARRNVPQHAPVIGAYGEMAVSTTADLSGSIVFSLMQTADWNETLYERAKLTQATGLSGNKSLWEPIQVQIVDKMGDVLVTGVNGMIVQQPAIARGVGFTVNTWAIIVEKLYITTGRYPTIGL